MLAALFSSGNNDAGRKMTQPNRAFGFIDMLSAGSARPECVDLALAQQVIV